MIPIRKKTFIRIEGQYRRVALNVEAQGFDLRRRKDEHRGRKIVVYDDPVINVRATFKSRKDRKYKIGVRINGIVKTFSGKFGEDGRNYVEKDFSLSDFNM